MFVARPGTSDRQERSRRYYEAHRDEILAKRAASRAEGALNERKRDTRKALQEYVKERKNCPCMDCGVSYPHYVMDFDHVRGIKKYTISQIVKNGCSRDMLDEEIDKCDVVCSNCHRERTHSRGQCGDQSL